MYFKKPESDAFRPNRTYVVDYLPEKGLIKYLFNCSGRKAIYQDGFLYGFDAGVLVKRKVILKTMMNVHLKEIPDIKNVDSLIGKRFNLIKFNCNHLGKYAK